MKRYFLFASAVVLMFSCSHKAELETDYKVYEVQGKVREIVYKNIENANNDVVVQFNKEGMITLEKRPGRTFEYLYDDNYIQKLNVFAGDSIEVRRTYKYDKHLPVQIQEYDYVGTLSKKVKYTYDSDGNRTQGVIINPYNDTLFIWNYTFEDGLVRQETRVAFSEVITPASDDNSMPEVKTFQQSYDAHFDYTYNDKKELVSIVEFVGKERISKTEYAMFSGVPLPVALISYWGGAVSDSTTMSYGFDEKGNWIFKRTLSTHGREQRQERVVKYYKD